MVNKNIQYQSISMTENTLLDDDYKHGTFLINLMLCSIVFKNKYLF